MSTIALVVAVAVLVTGAVLFVAWPYASPDPEPPDEAYQALHDLEQDLQTGKITPADYEVERGRLRAEAATALRELDGLSGPDPLR
jgi:hypothetical protein